MSIVNVLEKVASDASCNSEEKFNETIQNSQINQDLKQVLLNKDNKQLKSILDLPVFMASTVMTPDDEPSPDEDDINQ